MFNGVPAEIMNNVYLCVVSGTISLALFQIILIIVSTSLLFSQLLTHIAAWEESNGPFMYGGDRYADRVVLQDEHYIEVRHYC